MQWNIWPFYLFMKARESSVVLIPWLSSQQLFQGCFSILWRYGISTYWVLFQSQSILCPNFNIVLLQKFFFSWRQNLWWHDDILCIFTRGVRQTEIWFQHTAYKMSGTYSSPKYNYVCLVVVMFYWWIVWRLNYALQAFLRVMLEYSCRNTVDIISTTRLCSVTQWHICAGVSHLVNQCCCRWPWKLWFDQV